MTEEAIDHIKGEDPHIRPQLTLSSQKNFVDEIADQTRSGFGPDLLITDSEWVRNPLEAFAVGSDLRQAIWTAFDKNGIGIPFPQRQVYPMEWPPSKEQTHRLGSPTNQLQAEADSDPANGSASQTP